MLSLKDVALAYGSRVLFSGVTLHLSPGNRYGIVGANGSGKSSLLRVLTGEETPSLGDVTRSNHLVIGWLHQDQYAHEKTPILDVVIQGRPELWDALQEKERLLKDESFDETSGHRIAELEETIARLDGYAAEALAEELLCGLGIAAELQRQPLATLSGGFKLRVLLARTLFNSPDVLLLDEPTNYLDIVSIAWLENYLKDRFRGILAFVSHDVGFLNAVATHILDIDYGEVRLYPHSYDRFVAEKQLIAEQRLKAHATLEREVARQRVFIERFRGKPSRARQSLSREKQLEKIEWPDIKKSSRIHPRFRFRQKRPPGQRVLRASGISKSFGDRDVLYEAALEVERGEKVAIVGPNGAGKSTFLKILMGECGADAGSFSWGYASQAAYFAQEAHEGGQQTLLDWLAERASHAPQGRLHQVLGSVLFAKEEALKKVSTLSGGELARLRLALVMLNEPNILVLDEPTNHLDLEAREALALALAAFEGTVLAVSHDRGFLEIFASRFVRVCTGGLEDLSSLKEL